MRYDEDPFAEGRTPPARKDTRRWCGGRVGREHQLALVLPVNLPGWRGACRRPLDWEMSLRRFADRPWAWRCLHAWVCQVCQKVMRPAEASECPDRPTDLKD